MGAPFGTARHRHTNGAGKVALPHAEGGSVQALDRDGVLLAESEPITADVSDARVRLQRGDIAPLKEKAVRFRFDLSGARRCPPGGVVMADTKEESQRMRVTCDRFRAEQDA